MGEARPGGAVLPAGRVRVSEEAVRVGGQDPPGGRGAPKVRLVREDGVVRAIEVTCPCGEVVRVRCEY